MKKGSHKVWRGFRGGLTGKSPSHCQVTDTIPQETPGQGTGYSHRLPGVGDTLCPRHAVGTLRIKCLFAAQFFPLSCPPGPGQVQQVQTEDSA